MTELRINAPGAGDWVMQRVGGAFVPGWDHTVSSHQNGRQVGGFALCSFLGASITAHMAGEAPGWCTPTLLWMVFDYAFNQLRCLKVLAPVRSDNSKALAINLRGGFRLETVVRDVYAPRVHMMVLSMKRETCPWLRVDRRARALEAAHG